MDNRLTSLLACALLLLVSAPTTASAQGGWCARMLGGGENCGFATFGQCQAALSGNGGACAPNPRGRINGPARDEEFFGRPRNEPPRAARREFEKERQFEQERRYERERRLEQERRRAATTHKTVPPTAARPTAAPAPATPTALVPAGGIPLMDIDTNAAPNLNPDGIRRVQVALKGKGFDPGPVNGVLHPQMQAAMRTFQTTFGIEARGVIDNQTLLALGEAELARRSAGAQPK